MHALTNKTYIMKRSTDKYWAKSVIKKYDLIV